MILRVRHLIEPNGHVTEGGAVVVRAGRIERVLRSGRAVTRAANASCGPVHDLGEGVLMPGLVNAHAHLELGSFAEKLLGDRGFGAWIASVLAAHRASAPGDYANGVRRGAWELLRSGTTSVGDIASTLSGLRAPRGGLRSVTYREVLDAWDEARTPSVLRSIRKALPKRARTLEGVSPHAPYTTSSDLLAGVAARVARRRIPVAVHWSETMDELDWLERGSGALASVLPASPRVRGLDLLERAGLLRTGTSLVHGNHPRRGEPERIAHAGVALVHCPGTHAFFGRDAFPWRVYRKAGVRVALGSDSLASNEELDMRREMRLAVESNRSVAPIDALHMATTDAAYAIGLGGEVGEIRTGRCADLVLHAPTDGHRKPSSVLESLVHSREPVRAVWIGGRRVSILEPGQA